MLSWVSFVFIVFMFGVVLFLAYVTARFVGGRTRQFMKGKHLKVLETVSLGLDKQIHLVQAGNQFIILASSGKSIQMLTQISLEEMGEVIVDERSDNQGDGFKEIFDKYVDGFSQKVQKMAKRGRYNNEKTDENIYRGSIKQNLENIRSMNKKLMKTANTTGDEFTYEKRQGQLEP